MFDRKPFDRALLGRTLCAPPCKPSAHRCKRRAEGSPPYDDLFLCSGEFHCRTTCSSLRIGCVLTWRSFGLGACLPGLAIAAHGLTATRLPTRPVVDSLPLRRKPRWLKPSTGWFLRATFRIHNHLPPKQKKDIPFGMSFCFGGRWWIRTTEVIDDRFTVCSLWPLGKPSIFNYQLDWSWWTDLNPRPADYKSAALPTELHQHFIKSSCLSDLFSIPHAGVFVNRFIRNYCILFFRSIESDTCCRTASSALDKSG